MTLRHPPESTQGHLVDDEDDELYLVSSTPRFTCTALVLQDPPEVPDVDYSKVSVFVPAEEFMAVQKERDQYRRAMALVNGLRVEMSRLDLRPSLATSAGRLAQICASVGMDDEQGRAVNDLIRQAQEGWH